MLSISQILKSKTVWTLVLMAILNGVQSIEPQIKDPHIVSIVNDILTVAAFAFRIAPKQNVNTPVA